MFWDRRSKKKNKIDFEWGLKNADSATLAIYCTEGRLRHSPSYQYRLLCRRYVQSQCLREHSKINITAPAQIHFLEKDQSRRDSARILFNEPFNFGINLSASPQVGEPQFLIRRGVSIDVTGFDSEAIARYLCEFTQDVLEHIGVSHLECARKENDYTGLFWHSVLLRAYWEITN